MLERWAFKYMQTHKSSKRKTSTGHWLVNAHAMLHAIPSARPWLILHHQLRLHVLLPDGSFWEVFGSLPREEQVQHRPNRPLGRFRRSAVLAAPKVVCNLEHASIYWCVIQFGANTNVDSGPRCAAWTYIGLYLINRGRVRY